MGKLKEWLDQDWVRIDSSGNIVGNAVPLKTKNGQIVVCLVLKPTA